MVKPDAYPEHIYRYRPLGISDEVDERELQTCRDAYLWFSKFSDLNDPAEMSDARVAPIQEGLVEFMDALSPGLGEIPIVQRRKKLHAVANLIPKDTSGVCCFSESNIHQALWAYYANTYKGFCIQYHLKKLISLSGYCWGNKAFQVSYSENRHISSMDVADVNDITPAHRSFTTKHPDWAHEKEWRLVQREKSGKFYHTPSAISGIIMGPRIPPPVEEKLVDVCRRSRIPISKASFDDHRLVVRPFRTLGQADAPAPCDLTESALRDRDSLIEQGVDSESLDVALGNLRLYPDAEAIGHLLLDKEDGCVIAILSFTLADGRDAATSVTFRVTDNIVPPNYEHNC